MLALKIVRWHLVFKRTFCEFTQSCYFSAMPRTSRKNSAAHLHDKQSERDTRELRIDKVGVRGLRFPIQVRDKARSVQNTVATIGMFVDLPKEFKGTHMSRFVEVLNAHGSVIHVENIRRFCVRCKKTERGHVASGNRVSVFHVQEIAGVAAGKA
jgi:GTP cyclohydrolase FolE2